MLNGQGQVIATALQLVPFLFQVLDLQFDFVNLVELLPEPEIDVIRLGGFIVTPWNFKLISNSAEAVLCC